MKLYIDIDGVLLNDGLNNAGTPANHAVEFIKSVTEKHDCYWLTTHCRGGENRAPEYLLQKLPYVVKEYLDKIKATDWDTWKTDAIDFSQDFRWIDDDVYDPERKVLEENNASDKLIFVDLRKDPDQLQKIIHHLQ